MVMRKYTTLLQLLSLTNMTVLVCLLDALTLTSGWPQDHDLPFRQKAMVKNLVFVNSVLINSVLINSVLII